MGDRRLLDSLTPASSLISTVSLSPRDCFFDTATPADSRFLENGQSLLRARGLSTEVIKQAFNATEEEFIHMVKNSWISRPQMASVGSCCLVGAITNGMLYVANLGDSRAVLGRQVGHSKSVVAERLSNDHNVAEEVRKELAELHPDDSHIVVYSRGVWRIKGIIQVSRSIGDVYLKKPEFYRDPLFQQVVCPIPIKRPVMTAEPSIRVRELRRDDLFLIFASDGLWEQLVMKLPSKWSSKIPEQA
ncbi:hypothetical protein HPP92_026342 [Vanilla planifolia]|uniref:protein-serine/threonine phosphatase n=1 Tax=Vanilla planifolia TaxID=51239 RepID=A0A835PFI7_VANPL|nr:hypothetical protein HPP92_026342 [Vanilla planifolia]